MEWRRDRTKGELWGERKIREKTDIVLWLRKKAVDRIWLPEKHGKHVLNSIEEGDADQNN